MFLGMSGIRWKMRLGRRRSGSEAATSPVGRLIGRLFATLFFGMFFGLGSFFVVLIVRETWSVAETFEWSERRCEIERTDVVRAGGEEPYRPEVGYRTSDGGVSVSGDQIQRRELAYGSYDEAAQRVAGYPVGATVPCYVSSEGEAVLERGPLHVAFWVLLPLVFVAIGGIGLVATWWPERRDRFGKPLQKPLGDKAARGHPGRILFGFGLVFAAVGGTLFWFIGVVPLARAYEAQQWTPQRCTVEHSSVVSHQSDEGTTYSVDILYRWDRGRGVERSSRYSFFGGSSSGRSAKAEIVRNHPVTAEVACWVDPERRNEGVLERGLTAHAFVAVVPLVFFAAGCGMWVAGRRISGRRGRMRRQADMGASPFDPDDPVLDVLPAFEMEPGPIALPAQTSRWGRVLGFVCLAAFWNGIVAVFVSEAWKGWQRGDVDWFLTLFLVPFVLVGIALVLGIFHALLALANPRPQLVVSTRTPALGERLEIQWSFSGRVERIDRLRLGLRGREEATYRVGTNTHTATEDFVDLGILELPGSSCSGGHATVTIPEPSMHSFKSSNNKILWSLELVGEIRRWPDVKETYPLVVLPAPRSKEGHG